MASQSIGVDEDDDDDLGFRFAQPPHAPYSLSGNGFTNGAKPLPAISVTRPNRSPSPAVTRTSSSLKLVSNGWAKSGFSSLRISHLQICCAAKPETVQKVVEIVRKQLALPPESEVSSDSKFALLGADSLDTVEIVMNLEEEFDISVEEESSQNISTVQEAADLIEKLIEKKSAA